MIANMSMRTWKVLV
jgi:hypothetical protein